MFIINLIPLHVFALMLMGRYSTRLYTAYTTFFILGLLCSMQIPFVGFQPIRTSEHMASAGEFALRPDRWRPGIGGVGGGLCWRKIRLGYVFSVG